jgi:hypothetical protein
MVKAFGIFMGSSVLFLAFFRLMFLMAGAPWSVPSVAVITSCGMGLFTAFAWWARNDF